MSKKIFSSGLESVFSEEAQYEPNIDDSPWLLETSIVEAPRRTTKSVSTVARRPSKSFTSDLESLFAVAAIEQRPRDSASQQSDDLMSRGRNRPRKRVGVLSGLDSLIRDTTNGKEMAKQEQEEAEDSSIRKRVTFTYDRERFAQLKLIARNEGAYLKDIISNLLNEYISKYETEEA